MYSLITENRVNTAMRYETGQSSTDERYWPATDPVDTVKFMAGKLREYAYARESNAIQAGYSVTVGLFAQFGFDILVPFRAEKYQTRIMYSNVHVNDGFVDGYRRFDPASFRDYDYRMGPINKISVLNHKLVSIQEHGINFHYVNDRAMLSQELSEGELLLGQGDRLSSKFQNVTDELGTQHQWSIVETENAIYGVDWNRRKIWKLSTDGFHILSDELFIRKRLHEIIEQATTDSDITTLLPDNPVCSTGVEGFWNKKFGEIGWSFIFDIADQRYLNQTIVYNHLHNAFIGEHSYNSPFYMTINEDFYSFDPLTLPTNNPIPVDDRGTMWLHDDPTVASHNYYGRQETAVLHMVMNAGSSMAKVYDAYELVMNGVEWDRVTSRTEQQEAVADPWASGIKYSEPVYEENAWRVPEPYATAILPVSNQLYLVDSAMRGMYIERIFEYDDGSEGIALRSVLTKFRRSYQ